MADLLRKLLFVLCLMAFPTFVSAGAIANDLTGAASTTPTPPTHQADDILIACAGNAASAVMSASGWTEITNATNTSTGNAYTASWWWKRATGAGTAGPTITASGTDQFSIVAVIRGCVTSGDPYEDATATGNLVSGSTGPTSSLITTLGTDRLAACFLNANDDTAFSSGYPPSGWTNGAEVTDASGTDGAFRVIHKNQASAGDAAAVTIGTWPAAETWASLTLAFIPPSSGEQFTQTLGGSITPAGAIQKAASKKLTGASTFAGAIVKAAARLFNGSATATGSLKKDAAKTLTGSSTLSSNLTPIRLFMRNLTGSATASGSVKHDVSKTFIGSASASGSLNKESSKTLTGSSTLTSNLTPIRLFMRNLTGSATAAGSLQKDAAKGFTGSTAPSGTLQSSVVKILAASITAAGSLRNAVSKTVIGEIAASGTLASTRFVSRVLSGEITPSGFVQKAVSRLFTGSIEASGAVTKQAGKQLSGVATPSGSLSFVRFLSLVLSGQISPSGGLKKDTAKQLAGSSAPGGLVRHNAIKTFVGTITAVGTVQNSAAKMLSGVATLTGSLTRQTMKFFGGTITAIGNLTRQFIGGAPVVLLKGLGLESSILTLNLNESAAPYNATASESGVDSMLTSEDLA